MYATSECHEPACAAWPSLRSLHARERRQADIGGALLTLWRWRRDAHARRTEMSQGTLLLLHGAAIEAATTALCSCTVLCGISERLPRARRLAA